MHNETFPDPQDNFNETPIVQPSGLENPSRRGFLKRAGAVALGVASAGTLGVVARLDGENIISETLERDEAQRGLREIRERLRAQYGVEVDFSPVSGNEESLDVRGDPLSFLREKQKACEAIERALMQYPPMMYKKRAIISRIRVVNNLVWDGDSGVSGLSMRNKGDMYLEYNERHDVPLQSQIEKLLMTNTERDLHISRHIEYNFHHEIEHMIDDVDSSKWLTDARGLSASLEENRAYPYLLYHDELDTLTGSSSLSFTEAQQYKSANSGFAVPYGKTSDDEDRATIMQCLYLVPEIITRRMETDTPLSQKVGFMKSEYFRMSRGVMDDKYWEVVTQYKDNPKMIAEYVKLQSARLLHMSDEELIAHAQTQDITLSAEDLKTWRDEIALGVPKEAQ